MQRVTGPCRLFFAAALTAAGVVGCAEKKPMPMWHHENVTSLELKPEWQRYAEDNYRGIVLANLHASPATPVSFDGIPRVSAARNDSRGGVVELMAAGSVDAPNVVGKKYRRPYVVMWRQSGSGWQLDEVMISPGPEVPPEKPSENPMVIRPKTQPAAPGAPGAPADPTMTPPAGAPPVVPPAQ